MDRTLLKDMLVKHEGKRKLPYTDTVGKTTIGVGRNLTDKGISEATIAQMLDEDIDDTLRLLTRCPWFQNLNDARQRAIADMTFDLMEKILDFHSMIAALEAKDWNAAAADLLASKFAAQTGQRAKDLAAMIVQG